VGSVELGLGLAAIAALMANLAGLLKHRGCQRVASVQFRRPLASAQALSRSRWFAAGWGLAAAAWLVHVAALSMAPISLVQAVVAGGAVSLAVLTQGLFGGRVENRQWLALLLGAAGLAVLAVTLPRFGDNASDFDIGAILGFEGGLALLAAGLALGHRSERLAARRGVLLATLAGTLFAFAGVAVKGLTGTASLSPVELATWIGVIAACGVLAQYATVAALQGGGAVETLGLMGLVANAMQIVAGVVVFGDPLSAGPIGLTLQVAAFGMVCLSALLMPAVRNHAPATAPA
jgi:hypothetical protein